MPKVISIHEYILKPGIGAEQIENAVRIAERRGLFFACLAWLLTISAKGFEGGGKVSFSSLDQSALPAGRRGRRRVASTPCMGPRYASTGELSS